MITREQAAILADLARTVRPAWDTRPIVSAVGEVMHRDLREVAWALLTVAGNPEMRAPVSLTFEGDHWRAPTVTRHRPHIREHVPPLTEAGRAQIAAAKEACAQAVEAWKHRIEEEA